MFVSKNARGSVARPIAAARGADTAVGAIRCNQDVAEVGLELRPQVAGNVAPRREGGETVEVVERMRIAGGVELVGTGSQLLDREGPQRVEHVVATRSRTVGNRDDHRLEHQAFEQIAGH